MSPKVGTIMGKLSLVAGIRQEQVTNVAAVKPARTIFRKPKKETLYIMLDVTGDPLGLDAIYRHLIKIIGEEYFQGRGSATAKLRRAIRAANAFLLQKNLNALPDEQRTGGVTCIVLREGNIYVAQAGPTAAYVSYQGKLTRFPKGELFAEEAAPLGLKRGIAVRFYRSKVGIGDAILLTSGFLAQQASPEQIAQAVSGKDVNSALATLEELAGEEDASAMLIQVAPVEERERMPSRRVRREGVVEQPVRPRVRREPAAKQPVEPTAKREPIAKQPVKRRVGAPAKKRPARPGAQETWRSSLERRMAPALRSMGEFLKRLLPEQEVPAPSKRGARAHRPAEGRKNLWMGLALAIPVVVVILVAVVYWQQGAARQAHFEELVAQAQQQVDLAGQADEAAARNHVLIALDALAQAEELEPANPRVSELQDQAEYILAKIERVTNLDWIAPLWEYSEPGSDPGRVIIANDIDVYVLDKALDRVYKRLLNDAMRALQELDVDPVLLRKGDQRDPIVVGDLVDMVWAEAEGRRSRSNLLVLESGGSLLEYDSETGIIDVLPVGGSDRWIQPQIARSYQGDFYLLDSGLNQILRYAPDYSGAPVDSLPTSGEVDLAGVVDMALDGHIYILYADGRILKFLDGEAVSTSEPAPFEITGLYEPLQNPTALFTSEDSEFLYVADAGNERIVQFTKEGRFLQQFKAGQGEAFDQLKGLFVSEEYHLLYFVSGNKLYVTNLPTE